MAAKEHMTQATHKYTVTRIHSSRRQTWKMCVNGESIQSVKTHQINAQNTFKVDVFLAEMQARRNLFRTSQLSRFALVV